MISNKIQNALNEQLNAEFYAAYLYLAMSAYFQSINLGGFATWMRAQAGEELMHGMKVYDFINDREGDIDLKEVKSPSMQWDGPLAAFEYAYEHERGVSARINHLVDLSLEERDHATNTFLQWFVTEQVEEEATAHEIVHKLKLVGNDGNGLFLLDRDMGQRNADDEE